MSIVQLNLHGPQMCTQIVVQLANRGPFLEYKTGEKGGRLGGSQFGECAQIYQLREQQFVGRAQLTRNTTLKKQRFEK